MAFIPCTNILQVNTLYRLDMQVVENVYYVASEVSWTTGLVAQALAVFAVWEGSNGKSIRAVGSTFVGLRARDLTTEYAGTWEVSYVPLAGVVGGAPLPNSVAFCVQLRSSMGGRSYRGRKYLSGHTILTADGNTAKAPYLANVQTVLTALRAGLTGASFVWGVLSRWHDHAPRAAGTFVPIISTPVTDATLDSQRRRLPGRGQ